MKKTRILILLLLFSTVLIIPQSGTCPDGMISYWKLDEFGTVNVFADSYGNHNGSASNITSPAEDLGIVNRARNFNGSNEINIADDNDFDLESSFSVELWIKTTELGTGNKVFIGKRRDANTQATWWLGYGNENTAIIWVRDSLGNITETRGNKAVNDGEWHHLVGIKNDMNKTLQLYIDGEEENIISTFFTGSFSNTSPINIGHYGQAFYYDGLIDEVAVYNMVLNKEIITDHYKKGLNGIGYCNQFTTVHQVDISAMKFSLNQNYPNPYNPTTVISYLIPEASYVNLKIFDILGNEIAHLVNEEQSAGKYEVTFSAQNLSGGTYFYQLNTDKYLETRKMVIIK